MTVREDFEVALRARWDREALAVYGDHLMAEDDPRGEMIALDLAIDETGATPERLARRDELIRACFGDVIPPGTLRYGFFEVDATSAQPSPQLEAAFTGPAATFIRSIAVCGAQPTVTELLLAIAARPRPWLHRLAIRQWDDQIGDIGNFDLCGKLLAAAPHLEELDLDGRQILSGFPHPNLRRIKVSGFAALGSLSWGGPSHPAVTALDFAVQSQLASDRSDPHHSQHEWLLRRDRLPALVELDLSRNEPGLCEPIALGGGVDPFRLLAGFQITPQLVRLRLPAAQRSEQAHQLQRTIEAMPELRELTVRSLPDSFRLWHPRAEIRVG